MVLFLKLKKYTYSKVIKKTTPTLKSGCASYIHLSRLQFTSMFEQTTIGCV